MKKWLSLLLTALLVLTLGSGALAAEYTGAATPRSVLLLDPDSGQTLFAKDAEARVYPASTTKILTTLVVLEQVPDLSAVVTVDSGALSTIDPWNDSTLVPMLSSGEQLTVEDLLYGLLLMSGNDCANALAFYIAGSLQGFADLMNRKASEMGMTDSHFQNPHGMTDENHYTTARDLAKAAAAALDTPAFMEIVTTKYHTIPATNLSSARDLANSNRLLRELDGMPGTGYAYANGMKTGFTSAAGGCFVGSAEKDGRRLICLIFGDDSDGLRDRWFLANDLFIFGFDESGRTEVPAIYDSAAYLRELPSYDLMGGVWTGLSILLAALLLAVLVITALWIHGKRRAGAKKLFLGAAPNLAAALVLLACLGVCLWQGGWLGQAEVKAEEAAIALSPAALESTAPAAQGVEWTVLGAAVQEGAYTRETPISFGDGESYFALPGVAGFRGNNYRDGGSYGVAEIAAGELTALWSVDTGSLAGSGGGTWTGSGWTGQPLMVQWDKKTRSHMDLYAGKKNKDGLVEVIYPTLDGKIYFLDLEDGSYTRDPLDLGMAFLGTGALDPRGWPILYVGSGDMTEAGLRPRMFIVSLLDGTVLYEYGFDDADALRTDNDSWCAFDSSPLVDGETDTLIWPGENGILYTIRLNTQYRQGAGRLTMDPEEPVKARYDTYRSGTDSYWYGYESSAVIAGRYLYLGENGGMFYCVDLDTMELIWAQDTRDDTDASPVFQPDGDAHGYIFTAPSLHWTADGENSGTVYICKLDAETGEILWSRGVDCHTTAGVSGGVKSSPVLGRAGSSLDGLVIYSVSHAPSAGGGLLLSLDARNGSEVWSLALDNYAWSSPLALYDGAGNGWLVLCDAGGEALLIEGATGRITARVSLGATVEASPAAFNDMLVVGTRGQKIFSLRVN